MKRSPNTWDAAANSVRNTTERRAWTMSLAPGLGELRPGTRSSSRPVPYRSVAGPVPFDTVPPLRAR